MINIDTSSELHLLRFRNGIKLITPQNNSSFQCSIGNLLKLPFPIYFNFNEFIINCNESCAEINGFISLADSIGKKWYKPYKLNTISETLKNQKDVINNDKFKIIEDILVRKDETNIHALSFKMPWYNNESKIIGLFGCSIFMGKQPLAESITQIKNLGLLDQTINQHIFLRKNEEFSSFYDIPSIAKLSNREKQCLQYYLQNYTSKQTAITLGLSFRTIEEYFVNIKKKLGCRSKRELLNIFRQRKFHNLLD